MRWLVSVLVVLGIPLSAHAGTNSGWVVGSGGKVHGAAKGACQAYLDETKTQDMKYVIDRMEPTDAGDQRCYIKNSEDEEPAVSYTLVSRVRRTPLKGVALYRGTTEARRLEPTTSSQDLGPGFYYAYVSYVARSHAMAGFLDAWTAKPTAKIPQAVILEVDFEQPDKSVLDFSSGEALEEFEAEMLVQLKQEGVERMKNGEVNPVLYYKVLASWLDKKKSSKPGSYAVLIGPDYRFGEKQVRIRDKAMAKQLDETAATKNEVTFPAAADIATALVGMKSSTVVEACAATAKPGACGTWTPRAGRTIFQRRGWQSVLHWKAGADGVPGAPGDHTHLRIGDVLIDGTFMQFDKATQEVDPEKDADNDNDKGVLFVGSKPELIERLDAFTDPVVKGGAQLFKAYWDVQEGRAKKLAHKANGEVEWVDVVAPK